MAYQVLEPGCSAQEEFAARLGAPGEVDLEFILTNKYPFTKGERWRRLLP